MLHLELSFLSLANLEINGFMIEVAKEKFYVKVQFKWGSFN